MYHVVKKVLSVVEKNGVSQVDKLVLQIGEDSPVVPQYIEACYPAAVDGTILENTKLVIERVSGKDFLIKEIVAC